MLLLNGVFLMRFDSYIVKYSFHRYLHMNKPQGSYGPEKSAPCHWSQAIMWCIRIPEPRIELLWEPKTELVILKQTSSVFCRCQDMRTMDMPSGGHLGKMNKCPHSTFLSGIFKSTKIERAETKAWLVTINLCTEPKDLIEMPQTCKS